MIKISSLELIKDPIVFFNTDKVLMVDMIDITSLPRHTRRQIKQTCISYGNRIYLPIFMNGSPEKLIQLKNKPIGSIDTGAIIFDGDIDSAMAENKIYDFTKYYVSGKKYDFCLNESEMEFLAERYISPYVSKNEIQLPLN